MLPGSPSPQFFPVFALPLCDIYPNLLFQRLSQSSFLDPNSQTLVPLIPNKTQQEEGKYLLCLTVHIYS